MDFVAILQLPQVSKRPCGAAAESVTVSVDFGKVICNFSKKCEPKRSFEKKVYGDNLLDYVLMLQKCLFSH